MFFGSITYECVLCGLHMSSHVQLTSHLASHHLSNCVPMRDLFIEHYHPVGQHCPKCLTHIVPLITKHIQCRGVPPNGCELCKVITPNQESRLAHELVCPLRPSRPNA